jgi:hypothetical protein
MHPTEEKSGGGRCCGMEALNGPGGPLCPQQQTSSAQPVRSEKCQSTKSLRDSPLRGEPDREHGSRGQDRR